MVRNPASGTVNNYKDEFGKNCFGNFWEETSLARGIPEIKVNLHYLILDTIKRLNEIYIPFAWTWVKDRRSKIMEQVIDIEAEITVAVQCEDEMYLRDALNRYYDLWVEAIIEFSTQDKYTPF